MPHFIRVRVAVLAMAVCAAALLAPVDALASSPPATAPSALTSRPSTRPAPVPTAPTRAALRQAAELTRQSLLLLERRQLGPAEKVLRRALALEPGNSTNLYNLACVCALRGSADEAMDDLERSADAGYTDFQHIAQDSDLVSLHGLPRFDRFLARKGAYQLKAADRALRALKARFGDRYLYEVDEPDKLIFATNIDRATLDDLKRQLQAQAHSQWAELFEHRPDEFVSIVIPSAEDYRKLVRMPGVGGFYNNEAKLLIAQHLGQVMTHEFTHALHAADRAPLEQEHPIWLAEGLASMYEASTFEGKNRDVLTPHDNFRLVFLQNAAHGHKLISLDRLIAMRQSEFVNHANLAYGESSSLLLYLYEKGLLRKFYDTYKAGYSKDASGRDALEKTTGQSLAELEKSWTRWMIHRPLPSMSTGPEGAVLGTKLTDVNDGLRVEALLAGGPAASAGIKIGDVLIGVGDAEVRDMMTFGPVMSVHKPGERIVLKFRRGEKYLAVAVTLGKRSDLGALTPAPPRNPDNPRTRAARPTTVPAVLP